MKKFFNVSLLVLALAVAGTLPAAAGCVDPDNCLILRAASASDLTALAQAHGLTIREEVHEALSKVVLVEGPAGASLASTLAALSQEPLVMGTEALELASLAEEAPGSTLEAVVLDAATSTSLNGTSSAPSAGQFPTVPWRGYLDQPALSLVRVPDTHRLPPVEARGVGIVAIIDTGVDPDHPLLQGALVNGYDFLTDQFGIASEWNALDPVTRAATKSDLQAAAEQSYTTVVEGLGTALEHAPGTDILLEQSYTTVVEGKNLPSAFGHGTMVAGIVRMVAPGAKIMPLRVFDGDGTAQLWDIIRAIYFATFAGADVINMSFSVSGHSQELEAAINFAKLLGVTCVSSTGNEGTANFTYPAALGSVIGVASTNASDELSEFSNYGLGLATLAAPGEGVVTLYPGGFYAAAWGTSFSAAVVSGTVALLHDLVQLPFLTYVKSIPFSLAELALQTSAYNPTGADDWGAGRLDVRDAFSFGLVGY